MPSRQRILLLCAHQEIRLAVRSRWTQIFALVFAVLSLAVAGSGYVLTGGWGVQDFSRTAVSLVQLVLLLVPLAALLLGVLELTPERGAAEILFSQPVSRRVLLAGKLLGLFAALAAAQALGFGAAGLVVFSQAGNAGVGRFLILIGAALVLTALYLGLAALVSVRATSRGKALALALVLWFVTIGLWDVAALGIASLLPSGAASRLLITAVLVNPADAVRTATLFGVEGTSAFGAASLAFLRFTRGWVGAAALLGGSLLLWLTAPALLAGRWLGGRDL